MSVRDYENVKAEPISEPLHERVVVLEKRHRETDERLEELAAAYQQFVARVSRELGL